jgi:hypothetical protein
LLALTGHRGGRKEPRYRLVKNADKGVAFLGASRAGTRIGKRPSMSGAVKHRSIAIFERVKKCMSNNTLSLLGIDETFM